MIAISFLSPFSIKASTSAANFTKVSAIIVFKTVIGCPQLAVDPTARNSNLFPVNAKGEVLLRSVLSIINSGILLCKSNFKIASSCSSNFPPTLVSTSFNTLVKYSPINTEIIAGGASLAPNLKSLEADAMDALNISA